MPNSASQFMYMVARVCSEYTVLSSIVLLVLLVLQEFIELYVAI